MTQLVTSCQESTLRALLDCIRRASARVLALRGAPGTGKTCLIETAISHAMEAHQFFYLPADRIGLHVEEAAINTDFMSITAAELVEEGTSFADELVEILSDEAGIPFSKTAGRVGKRLLTGGQARVLSEAQQRFMAKILRRAKKKEPIVIIDDLQYWDKSSLFFLHRILSGDLDRYYKNLRKVRFILLVSQRSTTPEHTVVYEELLDRYVEESWTLDYPDEDQYPQVLMNLGLKCSLSVTALQDLYLLTGGNLALSAEVVAYANEKHRSGGKLEHIVGQDFFGKMITTRLQALNGTSTRVKELLSVLSLLGCSATVGELACLLSWDLRQVREVANLAQSRLGFIYSTSAKVAITHETYRDLFLPLLSQDERLLHSAFAACLKRINPADYGRRAFHHACAGEEDQALVGQILDALSGIRHGRVAFDPDTPFLELHTGQPLKVFADSIHAALVAALKKNHERATELLHSLPRSGVPLLDAEIRFLSALNLVMLRDGRYLELSLSHLDDICLNHADEAEVCIRALELKVVALCHLRRWEDARATERSILHRVAEFKNVAVEYNTVVHRLKRRSEAIHPTIVANKHLKEALAYFGPDDASGVPKNATEYLATLNNLCANELVCGNIQEAHRRSVQLLPAVQGVGSLYIRRTEIIWNNILIAEHLVTGRLPKKLEYLWDWAKSTELTTSDTPLIQNNIAVIQASCGKTDAALAILEVLEIELYQRDRYLSYVLYFIATNLGVLLWLSGREEEAKIRFARADKLLDMLDDELMRFMLRRHELVREYIGKTTTERSLRDLNEHISGRPRVGAPWSFWGRALILSDLQFWSET